MTSLAVCPGWLRAEVMPPTRKPSFKASVSSAMNSGVRGVRGLLWTTAKRAPDRSHQARQVGGSAATPKRIAGIVRKVSRGKAAGIMPTASA